MNEQQNPKPSTSPLSTEDNEALAAIEALCNEIIGASNGKNIEVFLSFFHRGDPAGTNRIATNFSPPGMLGLISGMLATMQLDEAAIKETSEALINGMERKLMGTPKIEVVKR